MGECPYCGPTPRPRTLGTRLSSTSHHPNYLKPPAFGQGAPLRQPEWQWPRPPACPPRRAQRNTVPFYSPALSSPAPGGSRPRLVCRSQSRSWWCGDRASSAGSRATAPPLGSSPKAGPKLQGKGWAGTAPRGLLTRARARVCAPNQI